MSSRFSAVRYAYLLFQSHRSPRLQAISNPCALPQCSRQIEGLKRVHFTSELPDLRPDFGSSMSVLHSTGETRTKFWNLKMKQQSDLGHFDSALWVFAEMMRLGVEVDSFTLPLVNRAISMLGIDVLCVQIIQCISIQLAFSSDIYFCNTSIEAYVKSGNIGFAHQMFDEMCDRDLVSWTSMISGYAGEGNALKSFKLFDQMRVEVEPNSVTMITMLQACLNSESVIPSKQIHCYLLKAGFVDDDSVRNTLLKAYSKHATSEDNIETLFHEYPQTDAVSWNIYLTFHISKGNDVVAKQIFSQMLQDVAPNAETVTIVATTLSNSRSYDYVQQLHCLTIKLGSFDHVLLTSFLNLYAKCGDLDSSTKLFTELPRVNKPEIITSLLDGYANLGALHKGKEIHAYFIRNLSLYSLEDSETSIVNMYAKCGSISSARNCFESMVTRDVIAWTSMIEGLGNYGLGLEAMKLFDQMLNEGVLPNSVTFLSLLSACSHSGLAIQGCKLFNDMKWRFQIEPEVHHYTCVVDLLGRLGKLREALCMILKMKCGEDGRIWGALLAASRTYMDMKIGGYAGKRIMEIEPENFGYRVVLSNMKAGVEQWSEVEKARRNVNEMEMEMKKIPGWSCVEMKGRIVGFVSMDTSHPEYSEIFGMLGCLRWQIQDLDMYCLQPMID